MPIKLKKQFKEFHEAIALNESNELIEKREKLQSCLEKNLVYSLEKNGFENIKIVKFIDQGSYKINTTIKSKDNIYDRDVAVILELDPDTYDDPVEIKKIVRDILTIENQRYPLIKEPCVTVTYTEESEEKYHIDMPIYAQDDNDDIFLGRGKEFANEENKIWEPADPEGLNDYFTEKLKDDDGKQLRRIIRYLKKWKSEKYSNSENDNEIPPSIALTLLACEYFEAKKIESKYDDLEALYYIVYKIFEEFVINNELFSDEIQSVEMTCNLPVIPYSDVLIKMKQSDNNVYLIKFYKRILKFKTALKNAIDSEFDHEAAEYIQKELGEEFEIPSKENTSKKSDYPDIKKEDSFA